jgi:hypothetical protein
MRALSIKQPWAELILRGDKDVENRSWRTHHRGPLLIHASRTVDREAMRHHGLGSLPTGGLVGLVDVIDCTKQRSSQWHLEGCFGWYLQRPVRLERLLPMPGRVGFFHVDESEPTILVALRELEPRGSSSGLTRARGCAGG